MYLSFFKCMTSNMSYPSISVIPNQLPKSWNWSKTLHLYFKVKTHLESVHNKVRHECTGCHKSFSTQQYLRRHQQVCEEAEKWFAETSSQSKSCIHVSFDISSWKISICEYQKYYFLAWNKPEFPSVFRYVNSQNHKSILRLWTTKRTVNNKASAFFNRFVNAKW